MADRETLVERLREKDAKWQAMVDGWKVALAEHKQTMSDETEARIRKTTDGEAAAELEAAHLQVADLSARLARAVEVMRGLKSNERCWCAFGRNIDQFGHERVCTEATAFLSEQENRHGNG